MWQISFIVDPSALSELEHDLKVDDRVLRHLVVKKDAFTPLPSTHSVKKQAVRALEAHHRATSP